MRSVFNVPVSYQTVLNYAEAASYYCHRFNLTHKGPIDDLSAGDETYIKINGKHAYTFLFISSQKHSITAYHVADNRGTIPALAAVNEAIRTARQDQSLRLVTDDNPSYAAAILYLNTQADKHPAITQHKVIGLQNLDEQSAQFRPFKQLIERLNRTYKQHIRPAHGFNSSNGAVALTTLFVTHYNFLRPHMALNYKPPIQLPALDAVSTLPGKWAKILSLAA
jgi:putative transposase